ncbi:IMPACT family protein [Microbacterium sp. NPDC056234]|uniref:IMPACT family protein n=1 Tax=Microbacterium sp. NPDC056234 TaxID=3345757 RepID=UPI0035DA9277
MTSYPSTIAAAVERESVIKKSRFIAHVVPVASPEDADAVIARLKKQFWDARHNCSAQVTGTLGDRARSSDDGEPSGTAGVPMLEVLRRRELTDVVAVVTRYFGGVKLGAGGLVRAYSSAVSEALDAAVVLDRMPLSQAIVAVPHSDAGRFDNLLRDWLDGRTGILGGTEYGADAVFEAWVGEDALAELEADVAAWSSGAWRVVAGGVTRVIDVPR